MAAAAGKNWISGFDVWVDFLIPGTGERGVGDGLGWVGVARVSTVLFGMLGAVHVLLHCMLFCTHTWFRLTLSDDLLPWNVLQIVFVI